MDMRLQEERPPGNRPKLFIPNSYSSRGKPGSQKRDLGHPLTRGTRRSQGRGSRNPTSAKNGQIPRISCTQLWKGTAWAPFFKERRMKFTEPTKLHRKSGIPRISCTQLWKGTAWAPFFKERRMKFTEPTKLHRKSGIWRTRHLLGGKRGWEMRYPRYCRSMASPEGTAQNSNAEEWISCQTDVE
jgi:hypothetical protein